MSVVSAILVSISALNAGLSSSIGIKCGISRSLDGTRGRIIMLWLSQVGEEFLLHEEKLNANGRSKAAETARTRFGWITFKEGEELFNVSFC